jgi:hypothetical protein
VDHHSGAFVGIDTSRLRNAVAVAEEGRGGEVRYLGEIDTTEAATRKLVAKLAAKYRQLMFCYEAGPTGHDCIVAAPSLIPKKPGDRVKTNRRDAVGLAKLSRAGELTAVWVPDERQRPRESPGILGCRGFVDYSPLISCEGVRERHLSFTQRSLTAGVCAKLLIRHKKAGPDQTPSDEHFAAFVF